MSVSMAMYQIINDIFGCDSICRRDIPVCVQTVSLFKQASLFKLPFEMQIRQPDEQKQTQHHVVSRTLPIG